MSSILYLDLPLEKMQTPPSQMMSKFFLPEWPKQHFPFLKFPDRLTDSAHFLYVVSVLLICRGHDDEVLDVAFDYTGQYIATASADGKMTTQSRVK